MTRRRYWASVTVILLLIPATLWFGSKISGRSWYLTCTLLILYTLTLFFLTFEKRRPSARHLVMLAVMCALAVVSRTAFVMINHFKPIFAVIMITGIAFGPEAGFLTGAVSMLASNFVFGMGAWAPWQMLSAGMGGFLAGLAFRKGGLPRKRLPLALFGFFTTLLVVGPILDTCTLVTVSSAITPAFALTVYARGIPVNLIQSTCTGLTMLLFAPALLGQLARLQRKYGIMQE